MILDISFFLMLVLPCISYQLYIYSIYIQARLKDGLPQPRRDEFKIMFYRFLSPLRYNVLAISVSLAIDADI